MRPDYAKVLVPGPDGRLIGLELKALTVYAEVEGPRARIYLDHVFYNPHDRELEGSFLYPLPDGASVTWFGMFQGKGPELATDPAVPEKPMLLHADPGLPLASEPGDLVSALAFPAKDRAPRIDDRPKGPWGELRAGRNPYLTPYAAGTPDGRLRMVYFPTPEPAVLNDLETGADYATTGIDPITGETWSIDPIRPGADGRAPAPQPRRAGHDWLLVVERR